MEIEEAQVGILYEGLANKDIDAFIDIWTPNLQGTFIEQYQDDFEFAGTLYQDAPVGVAVPSYMDHIDSIEDLNDYPDEFEGTIYAIDAGTGMAETTEEMLEVYDMEDFVMQNSSTPAMLAYAMDRIEQEEGVVSHAWRPHPMFLTMDIKMLEDPRNIWKLDDVRIGVIPELKEEIPTAYTLFSNMTLEIEEIEEWVMSFVDDGESLEDLAEAWLEDNEERVNEWLEK